MWGIFIIVFKLAGKLRHHSFGIRSIVAEDVIQFECFDESFSHIPLRWGLRAGVNMLTMPSAAANVIVSLAVYRFVVGEPFNWSQCFDIPKSFFNACQHDALRHVSTIPASGGGKGYHFTVASIHGKNNPHTAHRCRM